MLAASWGEDFPSGLDSAKSHVLCMRGSEDLEAFERALSFSLTTRRHGERRLWASCGGGFPFSFPSAFRAGCNRRRVGTAAASCGRLQNPPPRLLRVLATEVIAGSWGDCVIAASKGLSEGVRLRCLQGQNWLEQENTK